MREKRAIKIIIRIMKGYVVRKKFLRIKGAVERIKGFKKT